MTPRVQDFRDLVTDPLSCLPASFGPSGCFAPMCPPNALANQERHNIVGTRFDLRKRSVVTR